MKKIRIYAGILILAAFCLSAWAQQTADEKLFQEAKLLIFDEKWEPAQAKLEEFLDKYPQSAFFPQALYYKAKCLEEREKDREALAAYKDYLRLKDKNKNLAEDAEGSVIEIAFRFYEKGDKSHLGEIEERLESPSKVVRYYAAIKLSFVKEKDMASRGIPILKKIIREERDTELTDRARIALLRVSPESLSGLEERTENKARMLRFQVYDNRNKKLEVTISIPWALADLFLSAVPEKERQNMRAEGYDIDRILKKLQSSAKGTIIEIDVAKEGKIIKIWIE
jgi:tetratricopeptide (TPR) repeat protein